MKILASLFAVTALLAAEASAGGNLVDFDRAGGSAAFASALRAGAGLPQAAPAPSADKIVFGEDDRLEYFQVPGLFRGAADATVSLWQKTQVQPNGAGGFTLLTFSYGQAYNLCPGVRFAEQEAGAFCSGSLVGEDLVLTAGHCIKDERTCKDTKFVFGFAVKGEGAQASRDAGADDVYGCAAVVKRDWTNYTVSQNGGPQQTIFGQDYALVRLDRKVAGRQPLRVNRAGGVKKGDAVTATGHPSGLPLKFSSYATVVKPVGADKPFFTANLDIFGGNSGGPAFNAVTGLIEGVVVRADGDHFLDTFEGCRIFHVKPQNAGYGVDINKLDEVLALIPEPAGAGTTVAVNR